MRYGGPEVLRGTLELSGERIEIRAYVRVVAEATGSVPPRRLGKLWAGGVPHQLARQIEKAVGDPTQEDITICLPPGPAEQVFVTSFQRSEGGLEVDFIYRRENVIRA